MFNVPCMAFGPRASLCILQANSSTAVLEGAQTRMRESGLRDGAERVAPTQILVPVGLDEDGHIPFTSALTNPTIVLVLPVPGGPVLVLVNGI